MSYQPLSPQERAQLEAKLAALKRAKEGGAAHADPAAQAPPAQGYPKTYTQQPPAHAHAHHHHHHAHAQAPAHAHGGGAGGPHLGYGYDDDEEGEEEDHSASEEDDFGDHFFNQIAKAKGGEPGLEDLELHPVPTEKVVKRTVGEFELLRLGKMGDWESMNVYAQYSGENVTELKDNHERNALHYAADSGNLQAIQRLLDTKVPYLKDDKGMTPLTIALLNERSEAVLECLRAASTAAGGNVAAGEKNSFEEALSAFAVEPPKFSMSKPSPAAAKGDASSRFFWRDGATPEVPEEVEVQAVTVEDAAAVAQTVKQLEENAVGFDEWLEPVDVNALAAVAPRSCLVQATHKKNGTVAGTLLAYTLEGEVRGFGKKLSSFKKEKVAVVDHLALQASQRGLGVTPALLATMEASLKEAGTQLALFVSPESLPTPPMAVATIKWYRRACQPAAVFETDFAENVFPEFFEYDTILRADTICKNAIPPALESKHTAALAGWSEVDLHQEEQAEWLLTFLQTRTTEAVAEVAYVPSSVDALRADLGHPANRIYVRVVDDAVCDMVVLRLREVREHEGTAAGAAPVAQLVYALFTKLTGTERVEHVLLLAHLLLHVQVVFVASLFGITESDLAKSNFEEIMKNREFLYAIGNTSRTNGVVPATPASKLYPPVYFC